MQSVNKLIKLANAFQAKLAQQSAQAGDIEVALKKAGLWDLSNDISPILGTTGVADNASISIKIQVSPALGVGFLVELAPPDPKASKNLQAVLTKQYAVKMSEALKQAGISVADTVVVNWIKF